MSEPTSGQIVAALKAAGLTVVEMPGWAGRCRCHTGDHQRKAGPTGRGWEGPKGLTWHHTGGPMLSGEKALQYVRNILIAGNGSVSGPLCLAGIDADGRIILVGAGRANHIGGISAKAARAIRRGEWPMARYTDWRGTGTDGNSLTWGFEILAPMTPNAVQIDAAVRATAALAKLAGFGAGSVHGHGEASSQRSFEDPNLDMGAIRQKVAKAMQGTVSAATSKPAAKPTGYHALGLDANGKPRPISLAVTLAGIKAGRGGNVRLLQQALNASGWSVRVIGKKLAEDGIWGPESRKVYSGLQRQQFKAVGSGADGIPGPTSFNWLMGRCGWKGVA